MAMPQPVLLNNVDHQDLRVVTTRSERYGDRVMAALTFPAEFRNVQACYPIVFQKLADGSGFQPLALFGWRDGENLFLDGERWDAPYVPLAIERQPFMIGMDGDEAVIHIDMASPRISRSQGEPLFKPHGGIGEHLERMVEVLKVLNQGVSETPALMAALAQHDLLEPFALDLEQPDGSVNRWAGFYTVHEERLAALDGPALSALHRAGHLQAMHMVLASMTHLRDLVDRAARRRELAG